MTKSLQIVFVNVKVTRENTLNFLDLVYKNLSLKIVAPQKLGISPFFDLKDRNFAKLKKVIFECPVLVVNMLGGNISLDVEYESKPQRVAITMDTNVFEHWFNREQKSKQNFADLIAFCKLILKHSNGSYFFASIDGYNDLITEVNNVCFLYCKEAEHTTLISKYIKSNYNTDLTNEEIKKIVSQTAEMIQDGKYVFLNFTKPTEDTFFLHSMLDDAIIEYLKGRSND